MLTSREYFSPRRSLTLSSRLDLTISQSSRTINVQNGTRRIEGNGAPYVTSWLREEAFRREDVVALLTRVRM